MVKQSKQKYYAVKIGRIPGIYMTYKECELNVKHFPNARFKSFTTKEEAINFMKDSNNISQNNSIENIKPNPKNSYAFVDGSFNSITKIYGYGGFIFHENKKYILQGKGNDPSLVEMRNVAGEILGAQNAIEKAIELNIKEMDLFYDYNGIEMWAIGEWKRNKEGTINYYEFYQSIKNKIKVNFKKVLAHSGIEGNEEADKLANEAVGNSQSYANYLGKITNEKRKIKRRANFGKNETINKRKILKNIRRGKNFYK